MPRCSCFHDYGIISIPREECIWITKPNNQYCLKSLPVDVPVESTDESTVTGTFDVETQYKQTLGEITCATPNTNIKNGSMICSGTSDGDSCAVQCNTGHVKTNPGELECSCFERFGPILNKRPKCIWINADNQECNPVDQSDIRKTPDSLLAFRFQVEKTSGTLVKMSFFSKLYKTALLTS